MRISACALLLLLSGCALDAASPNDEAFEPATESSSAALVTTVHVALGTPVDRDPSDDVMMDKGAYVVSYNPNTLDPNWVAWNLDESYLGSAGRSNDFAADSDLPAGILRVSTRDYTGTGYDRGHVCPSAARTASARENAQTFLFTNMTPQTHELNGGPWRALEDHERSLARSRKKELYVVAGPIFRGSKKTIGRGVRVPDAMFRITVVLELGQGLRDVGPNTEIIAVEMPNGSVAGKPWRSFQVSVDAIEEDTGYDFLTALAANVESELEATDTATITH